MSSLEEIQNNICFEYEGKHINVPINAPWNLYYGEVKEADSYEKDIIREDSAPFFILHLTERCNLCCKYCFEGDKGIHDMPEYVIENFISYIKRQKYKTFRVRFFGGEPTLKINMIEEILLKLGANFPKEEGYDVAYNLFTNAVLVNDKLIQLIKKFHIGCFVSMDGCKALHDENRVFQDGSGSYDTVLKNAQRIRKEAGVQLIIRCVFDIGVKNISLIEMIDDCYNKEFDMVSIEIPWVSNKSEHVLSKEKVQIMNAYIHEYAVECVKRMKQNDFSLLTLYEIFKHLSKVLFNIPILYPDSCSVGKTAMAISTDGSIYPCHSFVNNPEFKLGNLLEGITNPKLKRKFEDLNCETINTCKTCAIRYYCTKRCAADSYWYTNDIYKVNPYRCDIEQEFFKAAMYIYGEIKDDPEIVIKLRLLIWRFKEMDNIK